MVVRLCVAARPQETAQRTVQRKKWADKQMRTVSWVERLCVHAPISFTLGFSTYLLLAMIYFSLLANNWSYDGWTSYAWACLMLTIMTVIVLGLGAGMNMDPMIILGWLIPLLGVAIEMTAGTCRSDHPAGYASRRKGLYWLWHTKTKEECNRTIIEELNVKGAVPNPYNAPPVGDGFWKLCDAYEPVPGSQCDFLWDENAKKCRRIFRSNVGDPTSSADGTRGVEYGQHIEKQYQCDYLGTRDTTERGTLADTIVPVQGYYWLTFPSARVGACVEDAGTCTPYALAKPLTLSHTAEYVVATAAIVLAVITVLAMLFAFAMRELGRRAKKKKGMEFSKLMSNARQQNKPRRKGKCAIM